MSDLKELVNEINVYCETYRHPKLPKFDVGGLYDLFPKNEASQPNITAKWPDTWNHTNEAGVYAFLTAELEVLYIGKASMNSALGYRLSKYCRYGEDRSCVLNDAWIGQPRYIVTVAMPNNSKFEAPALEEYLIDKISTNNNKAGT